MWTVLNQYTALFTLTIVALVHGGLVHNCTKNQTYCVHLLKEIRQSIKGAMNQPALNKTYVTTIGEGNRVKCVKHVFCLAENILKDVSRKNETVKQILGKLPENLNTYNNWTNEGQCQLQKGQPKETLRQFLCELDKCACKAFKCPNLRRLKGCP